MQLIINANLIEDILKNRIEFQPDYIELVLLVNEITELLDDSAKQKSIHIVNELPHDVIVYADRDMVGTILRNLVSNAVKFTNPGGRVVISIDPMPGEIKITVGDDGIGMDKNAIGKLFRIDHNHHTTRDT